MRLRAESGLIQVKRDRGIRGGISRWRNSAVFDACDPEELLRYGLSANPAVAYRIERDTDRGSHRDGLCRSNSDRREFRIALRSAIRFLRFCGYTRFHSGGRIWGRDCETVDQQRGRSNGKYLSVQPGAKHDVTSCGLSRCFPKLAITTCGRIACIVKSGSLRLCVPVCIAMIKHCAKSFDTQHCDVSAA